MNCDPVIRGRYVAVTLDMTATLRVCELEVYAAGKQSLFQCQIQLIGTHLSVGLPGNRVYLQTLST